MKKNYKIGDKFVKHISFDYEKVSQFAEISEDINPIHLDREAAGKSVFNKPIVHGMLASSTFSAVIANHIPGPGSIYLHQSLDFKKPVYHNQLVEAVVEITNIKSEKNIYELSTILFSETQEVLIEGRAIVLYKDN